MKYTVAILALIGMASAVQINETQIRPFREQNLVGI